MKAAFFATITLLCLLLATHAESPATDVELKFLNSSGVSLTESTTDNSDNSETLEVTSIFNDSLGLPVIQNQLTITESSQDQPINSADIDATYGKMMQDFAATLEGNATHESRSSPPRSHSAKFTAYISFITETIVTLIVLKIAFQFSHHRFRVQQIVPLCLIVVSIGAVLGSTLGLGPFNPARIGLSLIIMPVLLRLMTDVHEWATVIQMTLVTRLLSLAITWLTLIGMMVLFEL